jgi:hypothetical protein
MMPRKLYRCLVWLHPAAFRLQFEEEMLWIFDEAADAWGEASLIRDASLSLLRQWFIRSELWKWVVASIAGIIPLIIAFGSFLPWDRPMGR